MSDVRDSKPCAYCGELNRSYKNTCQKCKNFFYRNGMNYAMERILAISEHLAEQRKNIENKTKVLNQSAE